MNTSSSFLASKWHSFRWNDWSLGIALFAGLILSILSWFEFCVEHCSANQNYQLFGLPFAIVGIIFFSILLILHFFSGRYPFFAHVVGWLIASALGAEIMFIIIQKYEIGFWCPVCLSIATSVAIAALVLAIGYIKNFKESIQNNTQGNIMQKVKHSLASFTFILFGFFLAFIGISKPNEAEAAVNDIKERIAFGIKNSPIEVYFVTDWFCPSCKNIEPQIERLYRQIKSQVTFYFIDYPIHRKSLNFTPYNLAFLMNDKTSYFKARQALIELSNRIETPNDQQVSQISKKEGIHFKELSFLEIRAGIDFFDKIAEKYNIRATPSMVIVNRKNNKFVKLEGKNELNDSNVLQTIQKLKS